MDYTNLRSLLERRFGDAAADETIDDSRSYNAE